MYKYQYVKGNVLSSVLSLSLFKSLLFNLKKFWLVKNLNVRQSKFFYDSCYKFYYLKSLKRIKLFYLNSKKIDQENIINNIKIPKLS